MTKKDGTEEKRTEDPIQRPEAIRIWYEFQNLYCNIVVLLVNNYPPKWR